MKSTSPRYTHQSERLHHLYVTRPGISHVSLLRPNLANQSHDNTTLRRLRYIELFSQEANKPNHTRFRSQYV